MTQRTHSLIRTTRFTHLVLHLLRGMLTAATSYALANAARREDMVIRWSRRVLEILQVQTRVSGTLPAMPPQGLLLVANHISWLDIYLLDSLCHTHFVSKAEVRHWPLIGWLAQKIGTLFIERSRKRDTHRINQQIQETLRQGKVVAVFPEGTTTDGNGIRAFHTSLLQAGIDAGTVIVPLAIRYPNPDGSANLAPAYIDNMSFGDSLKRILATPEIQAEVQILAPIPTAGKNRRELARLAHEAIANALRRANPDIDTGTIADPPAAAR